MKKSKYIMPTRYAAKITSRHLGLRAYQNVAYLNDILSVANCARPDSVFNTGKPLCDLKKSKFFGVIFADAGLEVPEDALASVPAFIQWLKDSTVAERGQRVYPLFDIRNFTDNTGDPATGSTGNLTTASIVTSDAVPTFKFGYNGSEKRHQRLAEMTGASLDIFFVDDQFAVYGTTSANGRIKGYSVEQAYTDTSKFIIADSVDQYAFRITLADAKEYRNRTEYIVTNGGLSAVSGLVNATMKLITLAANVVNMEIIADGGTNLEPIHGAAIAAETFTARRLDTGAPIAVTSAADDPTNDQIDITLDSTAYTATPSDTDIEIIGPSAADLSAAGVKPYEFISLVFTKP